MITVIRIAVALLLSITASAVWASSITSTVYKCKDENGRSLFSDQPCGSAGEVIEYQHPESYLDRSRREAREADEARAIRRAEREKESAEWARLAAEINAQRAEACRARLEGRGLRIGMTKSELLEQRLWQYPDDMSQSITAKTVTDYWVYRCEDFGSVRLYLRNGRLSSIHK